jgi:hypothetical protein
VEQHWGIFDRIEQQAAQIKIEGFIDEITVLMPKTKLADHTREVFQGIYRVA